MEIIPGLIVIALTALLYFLYLKIFNPIFYNPTKVGFICFLFALVIMALVALFILLLMRFWYIALAVVALIIFIIIKVKSNK